MKKNQKLAFILFNLALFICAGSFKPTTAQEDDLSREPHKYEIAVDLIDFFSDGYPSKVLFKVNNVKDNQVKGAYRLGLGAQYLVDKYKITHDNENYETTFKEERKKVSLLLGYEIQKNFKKATFYYGADLHGLVKITDDKARPHVNETYNFSLVPFSGVRTNLTKHLSVAFEAGIDNFFSWSKSESSKNPNPDNRQYHSFYWTRIKLPYSLTINFNL